MPVPSPLPLRICIGGVAYLVCFSSIRVYTPLLTKNILLGFDDIVTFDIVCAYSDFCIGQFGRETEGAKVLCRKQLEFRYVIFPLFYLPISFFYKNGCLGWSYAVWIQAMFSLVS